MDDKLLSYIYDFLSLMKSRDHMIDILQSNLDLIIKEYVIIGNSLTVSNLETIKNVKYIL
jgi:hypothetical protein